MEHSDEWTFADCFHAQKELYRANILRSLMKRPDVDGLVCATDAGREGELIFRFVYQMAGCKKPFKRLWISSMEDAAIREGFANLKPGADYHYGILKCRRSEFASLSPDDYLISRQSNTGIECLVKDREMVKGKYKNMIVDNATLEDIMLFYIKGGIPCEG